MGVSHQYSVALPVPCDAMHLGIDDVSVFHPLKAMRSEKRIGVLQRGRHVFILRNKRLLHRHLGLAVRASHLAEVAGGHPEYVVHNGPTA